MAEEAEVDVEYELPEELEEEIEETGLEEEIEEEEEDSENVSIDGYDAENPTLEQQEALRKGWKPEGVEGKRRLSAEEFLDRQSLYDEIHRLKQLNKKTQKSVELLIKHNETLSDDMYQRVLQDLNAKKREAIDDSDGDAALKIEEQIDQIKEKQRESKIEMPEESELDSDTVAEIVQDRMKDWTSDNTWYNTDKGMRLAADSAMREYIQSNSHLPPAADEREFRERLNGMYKYVESEIKEAFPEKFMPRSKRPAPVQSGSRKPASKGGKKEYTIKDLKSSTDRKVAQDLFDSGVKPEVYFKNLEKSGYFD